MVWFMISTFWRSGPNVNTTLVNDADYIAQRNSEGTTFTVGTVSLFEDYKLVDAKFLINNQISNKKQLFYCGKGNKEMALPDSYNFLEEFKNCARKVESQGNCSSSYTIAPISVINDRWCRLSAADHPVLSPQGPLACDKVINKGCKEGFVSRTLDYAKIYGLVEESCYPYSSKVESSEKCQIKT